MPSIAHLDTTALDTAAKFFRTMQKAGADFTGPMQSKQKRDNLVAFLTLGCPKVDGMGVVTTPVLPEGMDLARTILGDDFISPEEVAAKYGFTYTEGQLEHFAETVPDLKTLTWLPGNGYMLVAGPVADTNLLGIRDLDNQLFQFSSGGWYAEDDWKFSRTDMVRGGEWLMLRKGPVPNSQSKNWSRQSKLVADPERVPNAAEVSYGVTVYRKVRGVYILPNFYVRTSSVPADGAHVFVGFDKWGLDVDSWRDDNHHDRLGMSAARNRTSSA